MADRWATFDCYGTLVDWNGGIRHELARLFGEAEVARLLESYHRMEPQVQAQEPSLSYREVMARVLAELALEHGEALPEEERDALGRSLPDWPVFAEVPAALAEAHERGWKLAILSNTDRDFIEASMERIGGPFELAIVADEIDSYKPAHRHWEVFYERTGADRGRHVHVAQSHFHDIVPAGRLGIPSIWINRLGQRADPRPDRELEDLSGIADVLDELVAEKT
jgi:2-haloacid dehalogenase